MRRCGIFLTRHFLFLLSLLLLTSCASIQVLDVKFYGDPKQYTAIEKPAKRVYNGQEGAGVMNAKHIGYLTISESGNKEKFEKFTEREAAKYGADFYEIDRDTTVGGITKKISRISSSGGLTFYDHEYVNRSKKAKIVNLYRIDHTEGTECSVTNFSRCLSRCSWWSESTRKTSFDDLCWFLTVRDYLKKGCNPNGSCQNGVPAAYYLVDCFTKEWKRTDKFYLEEEYKKMELLLISGLNPNIIPSKGQIKYVSGKELPSALSDPSKPCPSLLKIVRDATDRIKKELLVIQEVLDKKQWEKDKERLRLEGYDLRWDTAKKLGVKYYNEEDAIESYNSSKLQLDFLMRVDNLLVENGAKK